MKSVSLLLALLLSFKSFAAEELSPEYKAVKMNIYAMTDFKEASKTDDVSSLCNYLKATPLFNPVRNGREFPKDFSESLVKVGYSTYQQIEDACKVNSSETELQKKIYTMCASGCMKEMEKYKNVPANNKKDNFKMECVNRCGNYKDDAEKFLILKVAIAKKIQSPTAAEKFSSIEKTNDSLSRVKKIVDDINERNAPARGAGTTGR